MSIEGPGNFLTLAQGKVKTVDFSETIAASDLKVGSSRHLIEFIKVSIECQGHFLTLAQGHVHTKVKKEFLRNYCAVLNQIL